MVLNDFSLLTRSLKQTLKQRGMTYAELSALMGIPESTLKKWFTKKDGSFNRLSLICRALDLRLSDLMQSLEKEPITPLTFNEKQQRFFQNHRFLFNLYWLLTYDRMNIKEISHRFKIEPATLQSSLRALDKQGLIGLTADGKMRVAKLRLIKWIPSGIFMERLFREWSDRLLSDALQGRQNGRHILQYFQVTPESAEDFERKLRELEEEFARRTLQEMAQRPKEVIKIRFLAAHARRSFVHEV